MNDLVNKLAFGFIMAQFVPGAILVLSFTFFFFDFSLNPKPNIEQLIEFTASYWNAGVSLKVVFTLLAAIAGMIIHGLNWAVLGYYESIYSEGGVSQTWWSKHLSPIGYLTIGPILSIWELVVFLCCGWDISRVAIDENATEINKDGFLAFTFLQDFYLHFAQFYAHTAYAMVFSIIGFSVLARIYSIWDTLGFVIICMYPLSGLLYLLSRIQFFSLFNAEMELASNCAPKPNKTGG